jgi:hypothetical protein
MTPAIAHTLTVTLRDGKVARGRVVYLQPNAAHAVGRRPALA